MSLEVQMVLEDNNKKKRCIGNEFEEKTLVENSLDECLCLIFSMVPSDVS